MGSGIMLFFPGTTHPFLPLHPSVALAPPEHLPSAFVDAFLSLLAGLDIDALQRDLSSDRAVSRDVHESQNAAS